MARPWLFGAVAALVLGAAGSDVAADAPPTTLTIDIAGVSPDGGVIRIALYDKARYAGHDQPPLATVAVEARPPETVAVLHDIPPGTYAVKLFQDVHRSGEFETSALGFPEEPFGFSNDARPAFDQPAFDAAKFTVANGANRIVVHLSTLF